MEDNQRRFKKVKGIQLHCIHIYYKGFKEITNNEVTVTVGAETIKNVQILDIFKNLRQGGCLSKKKDVVAKRRR